MNHVTESILPSWITTRKVATGVAIFTAALYLITMNRTIGFVDKGELLAAASTLGIPHPTGYPTVMLLGWLSTTILPVRDVLALNILSAILTAAGAGVLTLLLDTLLARHDTTRSHRRGHPTTKAKRGARRADIAKNDPKHRTTASLSEPDGPTPARSLLAGLGAIFTSCTAIWWGQGNGFEVYSLHTLLMPLIVLLLLRFVDDEERIASSNSAGPFITRRGIALGFTVGLAFTNHLTTILLAPGLLAYYFITLGPGKRSLGRLLPLALPLVAGLLPYLWLPIRASQNPWFNWGDPSTLERFIRHISGRQYQVWFFEGWETFRDQSAYFFSGLPEQLGYVGLAAAVTGLVYMFRRSIRIGVTITLLFVVCILWSGQYGIMEIGPYYLTAILAVGIWGTFGFRWVAVRWGRGVGIATAVVTAALTLAVNYTSSNEAPNVLVEEMTTNVLTTLPKDAVVLSSLWDFWVAASYYMQRVEGMRPDVIVIDYELLRRSWYIDQLEQNYPKFMAAVKTETDEFRRAVFAFDHDLPFDPNVIDRAYFGMINAIIANAITTRPVMVTAEADKRIGSGHTRVPYQLTYRLMSDSTYLPQPFPNYRFHPWPERIDYYTAKLHQLYAQSLSDRAAYERRTEHNSLAQRYIGYALSFDPGIDASEVPSLPMNSETTVLQVIDYFARMRR